MRGGPLETWDGAPVEALPRAWDVSAVEAWRRVGSTNDRLTELARAGAPPWTVVVADEQTRGRGRGGSRWISPPDAGLWMSVLLPLDDRDPTLPLRVGLASAEAVEVVAPEVPPVGIKWPNDLMVKGRKLGGVLCERVGERAIVGIGINISESPDVETSTWLEMEADRSLYRKDLAGAILRRLQGVLPGDVSFSELLPRLAERDVLRGRVVASEVAGRGRAAGIDARGALVVVRSDGEDVPVVSGSVRLS